MGAGVVLVEHYTLRNADTQEVMRSGIAVLLFRDRRSGQYTDAGGASETGEAPEACASRELLEESAGLFAIDIESPDTIKYRVILSSGYTAFLVPIRHRGGIKQSLYARNLAQVCSRCVGSDDKAHGALQETDDMRRFFLEDIVRSGIVTCNSRRASTMVVNDTTRAPCTITKRTACVLQKACGNGLLYRRLDWNHLKCTKMPRSELGGAVLSTYAQVRVPCASIDRAIGRLDAGFRCPRAGPDSDESRRGSHDSLESMDSVESQDPAGPASQASPVASQFASVSAVPLCAWRRAPPSGNDDVKIRIASMRSAEARSLLLLSTHPSMMSA